MMNLGEGIFGMDCGVFRNQKSEVIKIYFFLNSMLQSDKGLQPLVSN